MGLRRMWVVALCMSALLVGCGDQPEPAAVPATAPVVVEVAPAKVPGRDAESLNLLKSRHAGEPLAVVDVSEREVDGAGALVIAFSLPLDPEQSLDAVLSVSDAKAGRLEGGWMLADNLKEVHRRHLEPQRTLSINIEAGIRSIAGVPLGKLQTHTVETRDQPASVGFASRGSLLPSRLADGLPVVALNVNKIDVEFFRIRPERLHGFLGEWGRQAAMEIWQLTDLPTSADLVYTGQFALNPPPNTRERLVLPLEGIAPLEAAGVYVAVMRASGAFDYSLPVTVFTRSDIGLSLRRSATGIDAFVQSLEDGRALPEVKVELVDGKGLSLGQGSSGADGHVRLPLHAEGQLVIATRGKETSLIRLQEAALDLAEFAVSGVPVGAQNLFVFGPRDLYRPGEVVAVNALLRDADGNAIAPQPIPSTLLRPDGEEVRSFVWQADAQGLYQYRYPLAQSAQTGRWRMRMNLGGGAPVVYDFLVEDFLPERLALDLASRGEGPLAMADDPVFDVQGRYLYGAPASGNKLLGQLFVKPLREAVPALPGFQFGDIAEQNLSRSIELEERWLDETGAGDWAVSNEWSEARSPLELVLQASVQESGGRPVTRRLAVPVWPAERLVGIRPLFQGERTDSNADARFELVLSDAAGQRQAVKGVEVRLVQERRDYFWQFSSADGWNSQFNQRDIVLSAATHDVAADERLEVVLPVEWGWYRIEAQDPQTGRVSSVRFFAGYDWQESAEGGNIRPDQVRLALDKPRYAAGDVARITVEPPAAGQGYLMVESSEGPLWWQAISVPAEGASFELPIAAAWARHDLYVSALVVRPGSRAAQSVPRRAVGVLHLPLDREARRLAIALDAPERIRPGRSLPVKVALPGGAGKQVRVIVSAVDVGILNLTSFKTPDPFEAFFGRKGYGVDHLDVYGQLIEVGQARRAGLNFGGDEDGGRGGRAPISSVTLVALQSEPVQLDAAGEALVSLDIPEFNGELRLMAQAWSDGDYGMSEGKTVVVAPLVVEMAAPRFVAGGDLSQVAIDVTNLTDRAQTLAPQVVIDGLLAAAADLSASATPTSAHLELAPGERKTLRLPLVGLPGSGQGSVRVTLDGLDLPGEDLSRIERSWQIGVRPAWPAVTRAFATALPPGGEEAWSLAANTPLLEQLDARRVRVSLSSRPPIDLAEHIRELIAYPYGCAEQTTSGLYPSLYAKPELLAALGIRGEAPEQRRARIDLGIERLLGMQRFNGSFGLWSSDSEEEYWVSAYVTDFLLRAAEEGFAVPETALTAARERLLAYLQNSQQIEPHYTNDVERSRFAVQAYAAYVLARHGQAPLGALRQVYERQAQAPSGLALAQLGFALKRMGDGERADELLRAAIAKPRGDRIWIADYGSEVRDTALLLALLEEHQLMPREREALYLTLADRLRAVDWLSTQERNALFMAGRGSQTQPGLLWRARVNAARETLLEDRADRALMLGDDEIGDDVTLANLGDGTLYHRTVVSGYPRVALPAEAGQIVVERRLLRLNGTPVEGFDLASGELVLVHLMLQSKVRVHDALVIDLLPAGLELENQRLDQAARLPSAGPAIAELLEKRAQLRVVHEEFLADRYIAAIDLDAEARADLMYLARAVTPGTYRVPPPLVESMFNPSVQGRGATPADLTVRLR